MAIISIASAIRNLHFRETTCNRKDFKHPYLASGITFPRCGNDLSWSCGISNFLQTHYCNLTQSKDIKNWNSVRVVAVSCLKDDLTNYFDFTIIGSGVAGLRYALEVAKHGSVAVITKAESHESSTNYAQGGVSAVLSPTDSVENHMRDTMIAGAYLCDEETVRVVCTEGPERIRELIAMGALFDHGDDGNLHLAREGGHSHNRIVHSADMTGKEIERALLESVLKDPSISIFEHHLAIDLLTSQDGFETTCHGVDTLNTKTQAVVRFISKVTLLASGGAGHIYPTTTNPLIATGDGIAMAHRAGAVISNMEFVQFHPTALADEGLPVKPLNPRSNAFLITEAVRGEGGILYNLDMERFMPEYDPRAELAPRDVVARSIDAQLKKRGEKYVLLDITQIHPLKTLARFPNIASECLRHGLDITRQPIPVVPAAHYMCGGVSSGLHGETNIPGLFVAGEVACTGLHGANRLASNSLLEALVFARRAVCPSIEHMFRSAPSSCMWDRPIGSSSVPIGIAREVSSRTKGVVRELKGVMWGNVGIVRSTKRLEMASRKVREMERRWEMWMSGLGWGKNVVSGEVCEMRNLFRCARLVVSSALTRHESRGLHYTVDFPRLEESERLPTVIFPCSKGNSRRQLHKQALAKVF